ncbi:hypothetical protein GA0115251_11193 [Streptomyces sp. TverLS-915]|uniref:hypothetical protein n=1 Tax=Streptomyces sp. TverLS-915 TaxID=1839763 RepID=UPI00081E8773|nr:hypothetical protein [Streptomyces sp. TverLS-915]SCD55071.1 hypothetical protein GA0115251_11193 [Streptomyces sp. TverLS-915]
MARKQRIPNTRLAALIAEARWTRTQVARQVNRLGPQAGLDLTYDRTAVAHWVAGTPPRPEVRPLILEALSARLGRPVTHEEAGLRPASGAGDVAGDPVEALIDLSRADMDPSRRAVLATSLFSAALAVPAFQQSAPAAEAAPAAATTRIGPAQVTAVRTMTDRVADILDEFGAGHARPMAAAFLVNTVGPWLRASGPEPVRRNMLAAASDLTYLTGWMAMHENAHGLGQTYYVKALGLAEAAGDRITYSRTLRGMSLQASSLRHGRLALELADSAADAAPSAGPRLLAFLRGQQAHAAALTGDRRRAHAHLHAAETALARADNRRDAIGGYDRTAYLFHVAHVLAEESDWTGSITALEQSIAVQPPQERQSKAHAYAVLAQRHYRIGHLDAACSAWSRFLDTYAHVSTARGDDHFATLRRQLRPHARARAVRELGERVREVSAAKA